MQEETIPTSKDEGAGQESSCFPSPLFWVTRPGCWGGAHTAIRVVIGLRLKYLLPFSFIYLGVGTHIPDTSLSIKGQLVAASSLLLHLLRDQTPTNRVWHQAFFATETPAKLKPPQDYEAENGDMEGEALSVMLAMQT